MFYSLIWPISEAAQMADPPRCQQIAGRLLRPADCRNFSADKCIWTNWRRSMWGWCLSFPGIWPVLAIHVPGIAGLKHRRPVSPNQLNNPGRESVEHFLPGRW